MSLRGRIWKKRLLTEPRRAIRGFLRPTRRLFRPADYGDLLKRVRHLENNQRNLYFALHADPVGEVDQRTALLRSESRLFSQNGEAGLLLHIFSKIGVTDRRLIEFGIGNVEKCNSTNLVLSFGWSGLLIDGADGSIDQSRRFHEAHARVDSSRVQIVQAWIEPETINALFAQHGFSEEIDLLSVDIDGNDYWVWKAIEEVRPRVVMIEYNACFGTDEIAITQYDRKFDRYRLHPFGWYNGASLAAFERLGQRKGYVMIGCDSTGLNAFFVRQDVAAGTFHSVTSKEAYYPDVRRMRIATLEEQFESLRNLPLERDD